MKKLLALLLAVVMVMSFAACTPKDDTKGEDNVDLAGTYDVKVWVAEEIVELTQSQIAAFNESNEYGIVINATIEAVGEGDAATSMSTDVTAGADIFCFAQDQTARLIQAGALAKLGTGAAATVTANNVAGSVAAVTSGDELYGYPLTADNGFFMYYDKSVISEDIIDSLEDIIAACEASGTNFSFELENSWYIVAFFFGTGCTSSWVTDNDGEFIEVADDFNSAAGLLACEGLAKLVTSKCYVNSSATSDFEAAIPSSVVVSGAWNYENAKDILGDNMGVADLPSFTAGGNSYHLGSYNGCKLMGVKPQSDATRAAVLNQLALYLSGEACQLQRFEAKGWGPSNLNAQASDAVQAAPHLVALNQQNQYSKPQGQIHGSWWDIAKVIATSLKEGMDAQTALNNYQASMEALFTMSDEEKLAWTVIGPVNGGNWETDQPMTKQDDGTWKSEALSMNQGDEFKVRQGKNWDVSYGNGNGNYIVEATGTYYVVFDPAACTVTLVAA